MKVIYFLLVSFIWLSPLTIFSQNSYLNELNKLVNNLNQIGESFKNHKVIDGVGEYFEFQGEDKQGNNVRFKVLILTQNMCWEFRKTKEIENGLLNDFLPNYIKKLPNFFITEKLIAVGTASHEGEESKEFNRSEKRAQEIARILYNVEYENNTERTIYTLPIGQFKKVVKKKESDSSLERPVIIIGTIGKLEDEECNFKEALYNGIKNNKYLVTDIENYSRIMNMEINEYNSTSNNR